MALIAKARLKELLKAHDIKVVDSGQVDKTQSSRPLVNLYLPSGEEIGQKLLKEGFARTWRPGKRINWCA